MKEKQKIDDGKGNKRSTCYRCGEPVNVECPQKHDSVDIDKEHVNKPLSFAELRSQLMAHLTHCDKEPQEPLVQLVTRLIAMDERLQEKKSRCITCHYLPPYPHEKDCVDCGGDGYFTLVDGVTRVFCDGPNYYTKKDDSLAASVPFVYIVAVGIPALLLGTVLSHWLWK